MNRLQLTLAGIACSAMLVAGCNSSGRGGSDENPAQARIRQHLSSAQDFRDRGLTDSAFAQFGLALEENPRIVEAHLGIGDILKERGDYERASVRYEMASALDIDNFDAFYNLGICKQVLGDLPFAIRSYLRALAIEPDSSDANRDLSAAYLQDNKAGLALAYARRAAELNPESYGAWANLGFICIRTSDYDEAVLAFRAATELADTDEESERVLLGLADSHIRLGHYARSINVLSSLIRTAPSSMAHERLGVALFQLRRYNEALDNFKDAVEIDDTDTAALNGLGVAYMTLYIEGNRDETWQRDAAREAWRRSLDLNPSQPAIVELVSRYSNI